jgi:hypothetical protein
MEGREVTLNQVALPAGSSLAQSNVSIAQRDYSGSQDLYRKWVEIFERARAVGDTADMLQRSGTQPAERSCNASHEENVSATNVDRREPGSERQTVQRNVLQAEAACDACRPPLLMLKEEPMFVTSLSFPTGDFPVPREIADLDVSEPSSAFVASPDPAEPTPESLLVLQQGESVCIIVRNTQLSEDMARRAAFATARVLKGHGGALQSLTLNGCTIFQQRVERPHSRLIYSA